MPKRMINSTPLYLKNGLSYEVSFLHMVRNQFQSFQVAVVRCGQSDSKQQVRNNIGMKLI